MDKSKDQHFGICALCGKETTLTFEHIPPRSAFNKSPVRSIAGDALIDLIADRDKMPWDTDGARSRVLQKGSGLYSLCKDCNAKTGHWYGDEYVKFAYTAAKIVFTDFGEGGNSVVISSVYALRFIKQVMSMFCSISGASTKMQIIRDFVLNKEKVSLPKEKYKLCMYFTRSTMTRQFSEFVVCSKGATCNQIQLVSEITIAPMGFILYFDPNPEHSYKGIDITEFADYGYNDTINITLPLTIYEVNNLLPLDYRSRSEIESDIAANERL